RGTVLRVGAYSPGVSGAQTKARLGLDHVVRLNWNESPFGPLPGVIEEAAADLQEGAWTYPEGSYDELRTALAGWTGAQPEQVVPGHGIQALTVALCTAFVEPGDAVVIPRPTYGLYAQAAAVAGATVHRVDCEASLALDLGRIAEAAHDQSAKLAWVCDPNNPTGLRLDPAQWPAFLEALPRDCVAIVDEAYGDYLEPSQRLDRLADVDAGRPVIVLRTFSKIFGLAGLRLGYALVHASLAPYLNAVHEPFNVNRAALAAGLASLRRTDLLATRRRQVREAAERLTAPLARAGIRCLPSDANFVLVDLGTDDLPVTEALAREGLLVRPGSELGVPGYVRVTVADGEIMELVAQKLEQAVGREAEAPDPAMREAPSPR
ncbi:MAG: histidinol-phosphate aminotransferase family protein, partial [Actinomycetota bacterium]|nr:histidinol-phosphate aminotransferase family protein [Actinomycetota bacterium]